MQIGVVGISHKTASLSLLEKVTAICHKRLSASVIPLYLPHLVLLSTCNRTEIYFCSEEPDRTHGQILDILRGGINEPFEMHLYSFFGRDCFTHLSRVTAGLESRLIGESEIQGQVKRAYRNFSTKRALPKELHFLFQKSLKNGKEIRSRFPYFGEAPSLEGEVVRMLDSYGAELEVLLIGASPMMQGVYHLLKNRCRPTLITRDKKRAERTFSLPVWEFDSLKKWPDFDVVIAATRSPNYLLHPHETGGKRHLLIDLSVPRVIDPLLGQNPLCQLVNLEDLQVKSEKKRHSLVADVRLRSQTIEEKVGVQIERLEKMGAFTSLTHAL